MLTYRANRVVDNPESVKTIDSADVRKAFSEMLTARKPKMSEQDRMRNMLLEAAQGLGEPQVDSQVMYFRIFQITIKLKTNI